MSRVLVVDDESSLREMVRIMLTREGYEVDCAGGVGEALELVDAGGDESLAYDVVLTDLQMGERGGMELLRELHNRDESVQVLMMTAYATTQTAVEAMRLGAYDYIEKPFKRGALLALVAKACEKRALLCENRSLRLRVEGGFGGMIGQSKAMAGVYEAVRRLGASRTHVLIMGASGTGKELVARAVHAQGGRERPFVALNCGAISESLVESEFFGYVRGAFTGANKDKQGLVAAANHGTLFLDEVGELSMSMQVKLLRVLQERTFTPVGSTQEQEVEFSVISATNRDLMLEVKEKRFRHDLFYRLNVFQINLPKLSERLEDIPALVAHFVEKYSKAQHKDLRGVQAQALKCLMAYQYPGNIRELENIVERAVILEQGDSISVDSLPLPLQSLGEGVHAAPSLDLGMGLELESVVEEVERNLIAQAMERSGGNRTEAARLLGISFRSLRYRLKKYGYGD